jgi:hypothetical protein
MKLLWVFRSAKTALVTKLGRNFFISLYNAEAITDWL